MSPTTVDLLVRALSLLCAAWLVVALLHRRSASLRATVWTLALGGLLVLPVLTSVGPSLRVAVWPAGESRVQGLPAEARSAKVGPESRVQIFGSRVHGPESSVSSPGSRVQSPAASSGSIESVISVPPVRTKFTLSWSQAGLLLWALVAVVLMVRIIASHVSLARLARGTGPVRDAFDANWTSLIDDARRRLSISRPVAVCMTDAIAVPAVAGVWRPVLLLPADAADWTPEMQRDVVLHELAHVARWDALGQLVSRLACAVYWCVPVVWHGARRAAALREQASDDVVLMSGVRPSAYAENLLSVARISAQSSRQSAALAMASPIRIRERIVAILDPGSRREHLGARARTVVLVVAASVIGLAAAIEPTVKAAPLRTTVVTDTRALDGPVTNAPVTEAAVARGPVNPASVVHAPDTPASLPLASATALTAGSILLAEPPAPVPAVQPASNRPCDRDMDRSSSTTNDDGARKSSIVKLSGKDCSVELRTEGTITFNNDFTDIISLSSGGSFKLDVTEGGVRRELELRPQGGSVSRTWRVDGRERPFDNDARAWFGSILISLDRRTAMFVDYRLPAILKQGGVDAVLKETALMAGDYARGRYYLKLFDATRLSRAEMARLMRQAESLTKSDHYGNELLTAVAKQGFDDPDTRAAAFGLITRMSSDHYRASGIKTVVGSGKPLKADMDFLVKVMPRIESDHYKLDVLTTILNGPLDARQRTELALVAKGIESDHYATEFLKAMAKDDLDPAGRQALFDVVATIESDHYVVEVLKALIGRSPTSSRQADGAIDVLPQLESDHYRNEAVTVLLSVRSLTESDLVNVINAVRTMDGDHYKSEALQHIAAHAAATERVRRDILAAAERLSDHYRNQVRRAAGGR